MKALRETKHSELLKYARALEQGKFPVYRTRTLSEEEILILERAQNQCEDWNLVRVDVDFDPHRVKRCFFSGHVSLPKFFGTLLGSDGVPFSAGVYDSTLHECVLENGHLSSIGTLSRMIIASGCIVRNVGSLVVSGRTTFGSGREISMGNELEGRILRPWPEIPLDAASTLLMSQGDRELQNLWNQTLDEFVAQISSTMGYVGKDSTITNTPSIRNCWIGAAARIEGAQKLHDSTLLSSVEQPCVVRDGAILEHSLLQWGVVLRSGAYVSSSVLCEESGAQKHAKISRSFIGPNTQIQEGEVTASLLGPFVAFHHQSILISVLWPEGMGNVSHGAAVGCNHTGRQPDQECFPGRGTFFGLGCIVKFPCNLREAPWTLIAPGVTAPPQKVEFPFSLIAPGRNPKAFRNEIIPAWMLRYNAYALVRNESKFFQRNKSRRQNWSADIFGYETAQLVLRSYHALAQIQEYQETYSEIHLPGLGKNYLTEANRQKAMKWYRFYLERFALLWMIQQLEKMPQLLRSEQDPRRMIQNELMREVSKIVELPDSIALVVKHYRNVEKRWFEQAQGDWDRDARRGELIQDDYLEVHSANKNTELFRAEYEKALTRCKELIRNSKNGDQSSESRKK